MDEKVDPAKQEFTPRPYQKVIFDEAVKMNSIIYLPTGSGKTFIAVLLIKHFSEDFHKPCDKGGKRAIFLVNTVPLVNQQSEYLARHTGFDCRGYKGIMEVDRWSESRWKKEIETFQILVMTAQIFLNILNSGVMTMEQCSIVFFDECHKAFENHPMRLIPLHLFKVAAEKQPRIIGLSATLLNFNPKLDIEHHLSTLELNLHSKIITVDNMDEVKAFSTSPEEVIIYYNPVENRECQDSVSKLVLDILKQVEKVLMKIIQFEVTDNKSSKEFQSDSEIKKLSSIVFDIVEQIFELGVYGGNEAVLSHLSEIEKIRKSVKSSEQFVVCVYVTSQLLCIRAIIERKMKEWREHTRIFKFSSDKVLKLIQMLKNFNTERTTEQQFCCIVFVQRKVTAKVIYNILKILAKSMPEFSFLRPGFMIGDNNTTLFKADRPDISMSEWNKKSLEKFRSGIINCLISTEVLDEGVDIPVCTLIVRFYFPQDFRSYVQSKGRARHSSSQYKVLIDESKAPILLQKYREYRTTEKRLENLLIGKSKERENVKEVVPEVEKMLANRYEVFDEESGITSYVDENSAIGLINKYCSNLYKSNFCALSPTWMLLSNSERTVFQVSLELPHNSPLHEKVYGDVKTSKEDAKKSAALKTCVKLHKIGELSDRLVPKPPELVTAKVVKSLLTNWVDENLTEDNPKRLHDLVHAEPLFDAYPKEDKLLYLHFIEMRPISSTLYRKEGYDLLCKNGGYAILSTKKLPPVPDFPIFMRSGEFSCNIRSNEVTLHLTNNEIEKLKEFHALIFTKIVPVMKNFMVFNKHHLDNSFLVVPVDEQCDINWDLINTHRSFSFTDLKGYNNRDYDDLKLTLIQTKYRCNFSLYLVTNVRYDLSMSSPFPNREYYSYFHYYYEKYQLIPENISQPLLEVRPLTNSFDYHKPCIKKERSSNHSEFLIPEFSEKLDFPTIYILKASVLPTVFYRLSHLLIADQLRVSIAKDTGVSFANKNLKWQPLVIEEKEDTLDTSDSASELTISSLDQDFSDLEICSPILKKFKRSSDVSDDDSFNDSFSEIKETENIFLGHKFNHRDIIVPPLDLHRNSDSGPEIATIAKALTTAHADDIVNLERLETLGDAFLKFATSLYIHEEYPQFNEGCLDLIKGKVIGNRNLYYCGKSKSIPGMIRVYTFDSFHIVPSFAPCRDVQKFIHENKMCPTCLHQIKATPEERLEGSMKTDFFQNETDLKLYEQQDKITNMEMYMSTQKVNDKTVADAVEAILGTYLQECGLEGAMKTLQWFQILPQFEINNLLSANVNIPSIDLVKFPESVSMVEKTEKQIGYRFNNPAYLIEAMSHPTYLVDKNSKSYERLEFLGDSIIDFVITKYIFQRCCDFTPGQLTDLRSALVNNILFACLTVKYHLHASLLMMAPNLQIAIDRFVKFQEKRKHKIDTQILEVLLERKDCNLAETIEAPKVLSDIFESVIGAVYLDSGKDLSKVWQVLYRLMYEQIEQFISNTPIQPVRCLSEMTYLDPRFSKSVVIKDTGSVSVAVRIKFDNRYIKFNGFGATAKAARQAAAQHAIEYVQRHST